MNKKTRQIDVAIVGYGIEGRTLAQMISSRTSFKKIVVFDSPDAFNLGADSTRNQSITHSGLLYGENNIVSAKLMLYSAYKMHETVGIPIPSTGGVLAVKEDEVEKVYQIAETLKIKSEIQSLSKETAQRRIGKFCKSKPEYLRIPETVFAEDLILEKLDFMARDNGVELIKAKIKLLPNPNDETRCIIDTGEEFVESEFLVLSAGTGLIELFNQLGIETNLSVFSTPLLRFPISSEMETRLFVDKSENGLSGRGLFVARHKINHSDFDNCLVVAKSIRRELKGNEIYQRNVYESEEDEIRRAVPKSILPAKNSQGYRVIAGHKTEFIKQNGEATIDSKLLDCGSYKNVIGVIPGKATLAYDAAEQVLDWLFERSNIERSRRYLNDSIITVTGTINQPVNLHYDSIYDDILDEVDKSGGKVN